MKPLSLLQQRDAMTVAGFAVTVAAVLWWLASAWTGGTMNHDIFWLYTGYQRLGDGGTLLEDFYELNPPLNLYYYTPAFFLAAQGFLPLEHAVFLYGLVLTALSAAACFSILRHWDGMTRQEALFFCLLFFLGMTLMPGADFAQRDDLIALGAVPLCCLILSRNRGYGQPRPLLRFIIVIAGTFLLLLKPHYGLLPGFLMIHRALSQKRLSAVFDGDFLIMAGSAAVYALLTLVLFPEYARQILPNALDLYAGSGARFNLINSVFYTYLCVFLLAVTWHPLFRDRARNARVFAILGLLSLLVYFAMNKGYSYHLIPAKIFMLLALGSIVCLFWQIRKPERPARIWILAGIFSLLLSGMPQPFMPRPDAIRAQTFTQRLTACEAPCGFLVLGGTVRVIQLASYYSGRPHVSRFAKLWFEGLAAAERKAPGDPVLLAKRRQLAGMVAADMARHRPELIFACNDYADYISYLAAAPEFAEQMEYYERAGQVDMNQSAYFSKYPPGPGESLGCDIYQRKTS